MAEYLQGGDLAAFGVPSATPAQIQQASLLIDAYVDRPEGLTFTGSVMDNTGAAIVETFRAPKRPAAPVNVSRPNVDQILSIYCAYPNTNTWTLISATDYEYVEGEGITFKSWLFPQRLKITFLAGFLYANLPVAIKQACANIITAQANFPELNGNIQSLKTGAASVTRFRDSVLDADTKRLLAAYCRPFAI
jgi:hypothetical protein